MKVITLLSIIGCVFFYFKEQDTDDKYSYIISEVEEKERQIDSLERRLAKCIGTVKVHTSTIAKQSQAIENLKY